MNSYWLCRLLPMKANKTISKQFLFLFPLWSCSSQQCSTLWLCAWLLTGLTFESLPLQSVQPCVIIFLLDSSDAVQGLLLRLWALTSHCSPVVCCLITSDLSTYRFGWNPCLPLASASLPWWGCLTLCKYQLFVSFLNVHVESIYKLF